jgi:hypothetical protein
MVSRQTRRHFASSLSIRLARAFIESSLLSWIALAVDIGLLIASDTMVMVCNLASFASPPH